MTYRVEVYRYEHIKGAPEYWVCRDGLTPESPPEKIVQGHSYIAACAAAIAFNELDERSHAKVWDDANVMAFEYERENGR